MDKIRVMIIEDEDLQYEIYEECLGQFELKRARSGTEAIKYASNFVPEVIVLDHVLENEELGLEDIHVLKKTIQTAVSECGEKEVIKQFESLERSKRSDIETLLSRSTDRLSRQHQIRLRLEDSKQRPNISALAREYRVARRTIIRDLQEMIRRGELDPSVYPKWDTEIEG